MIAQNKTNSSNSSIDSSPSLDTYIPSGFVLVTLQLINSDSIDSMIGNFGLVDLYPATQNADFILTKDTRPIATHLRLIRAPNNPNLFGVLVSEESRSVILQLANPVFAVIKGPQATKLPTPLKPPSVSRRSRSIKYGELL